MPEIFIHPKNFTFSEIIHGDCIEKIKNIADESIDLVLTSPPYDNLRIYEGNLEWGENIWADIFNQLFKVLKIGGIIVWIVGDATIKGSETGSSFRQALYALKIGFKLHDTMIWKKDSSPYQHKNRYISSFEYMFIFSKGAIKTYNIIKDRKNKWAGNPIHGTERLANGKTRSLSKIQKNKMVKEYGSRLNIWEISPDKNNKTCHPAVFPYQLAYDHIISWSNEGDIILDPFLGSGTSGLACVNLKRNFIGIEKEEKYFKLAVDRIEKELIK